jgi:hypothetical protein
LSRPACRHFAGAGRFGSIKSAIALRFANRRPAGIDGFVFLPPILHQQAPFPQYIQPLIGIDKRGIAVTV